MAFRLRLIAASAVFAATVAAPVPLLAQDYDMTFTLPSAGKSGCLVCHGDANLARVEPDGSQSFFVDESVLSRSAHGKSKKYPNGINCTACHTDFAYKAPHVNGDWRRSAKLACKNCKEHQDDFDAYGRGVHSIAPKPGATAKDLAVDAKKPLCGDCHSHAHTIGIITPDGAKESGTDYDPAERRRLHSEGKQMCGRSDCHADAWESYQDYYHGAAYRRGATDAPACWQCHAAHDVLESKDTRSYTNDNNLVETCSSQAVPGGKTCHNIGLEGEAFVTPYKEFVHRKADQYEANWLYRYIRTTREGIALAFTTLAGAIRGLF